MFDIMFIHYANTAVHALLLLRFADRHTITDEGCHFFAYEKHWKTRQKQLGCFQKQLGSKDTFTTIKQHCEIQ